MQTQLSVQIVYLLFIRWVELEMFWILYSLSWKEPAALPDGVQSGAGGISACGNCFIESNHQHGQKHAKFYVCLSEFI